MRLRGKLYFFFCFRVRVMRTEVYGVICSRGELMGNERDRYAVLCASFSRLLLSLFFFVENIIVIERVEKVFFFLRIAMLKCKNATYSIY